jgi:hypothetical protein
MLIFLHIFVVYVLNVVCSSSGHAQVDEDYDSDEINVEDCDGDDDESIEEEDDNSD